MENVRKIGDYTVLHSIEVGHREIALAEKANAPADERFLCCYIEYNAVFERYTECVVSADFAEIAKIFGERITAAADEIITENEKTAAEIGFNDELTAADCRPVGFDEDIEGKVIVIRGDRFRPEMCHATNQLYLCTGGFGSAAHKRGRTCFCRSLYGDLNTSYYRSDVLGIMEPENLPHWARKGLDEIMKEKGAKV